VSSTPLAKTEGMADRIEKHPELFARLHVRLRRSDRECVLLRGVEVLHLEVEVKLLRYGTIRPGGRHVVINLLEVEGGMVAVHQIGAGDVTGRDIVCGSISSPVRAE